jgi:N-acetylmuramoyl-L-alanine amidase
MMRVSKPGIFFVCLLIALAGCSTARRPSQRSDLHSPARTNAPVEIEHVTEGPRLAPPPVVPPSPTNYADTWVPLSRWSRENQLGILTRISPLPSPAFALNTSNGVLIVQVNSLVARWNGLEFHLGFKPQWIGDQPFVHVLDLRKNIEPLVREQPPTAETNRVIIIDAGHGGHNTGTQSVVDGVDEKEFTLDWARRLEPLLAAGGWQVFLTRTNDADVALSNRVTFAGEHKATLFISLHFNSAAPNQEQAGLETFCLTPNGMPSTLTRDYEDDVTLTFPNNAFDGANLLYAVRLHRALLKASNLADRGVRRARFMGVLRGQNCPALLIEGGYLSNPAEARRIADPAFRQKLAEAIAAELAEPEVTGQKTEMENQTSDGRPPATEVPASNSPAPNAPLH